MAAVERIFLGVGKVTRQHSSPVLLHPARWATPQNGSLVETSPFNSSTWLCNAHYLCAVTQVRSWLDDWESEATQAREAMAAAAADDYKFAENNPFLNVSRPVAPAYVYHT